MRIQPILVDSAQEGGVGWGGQSLLWPSQGPVHSKNAGALVPKARKRLSSFLPRSPLQPAMVGLFCLLFSIGLSEARVTPLVSIDPHSHRHPALPLRHAGHTPGPSLACAPAGSLLGWEAAAVTDGAGSGKQACPGEAGGQGSPTYAPRLQVPGTCFVVPSDFIYKT